MLDQVRMDVVEVPLIIECVADGIDLEAALPNPTFPPFLSARRDSFYFFGTARK